MEIKFLRYESIQSLKWLLTSSLLFSGKNRDNLLWNSRFSVSFCFSGSRTCCDIRHSYPRTPSGSYVIDPDGEGGEKPFKDFCDTADEDSVGVTVKTECWWMDFRTPAFIRAMSRSLWAVFNVGVLSLKALSQWLRLLGVTWWRGDEVLGRSGFYRLQMCMRLEPYMCKPLVRM